jgi:DNA (cytosine-5)-methyltransferase 1
MRIIKKRSDSGITVTDQFCGAGGSSQGVRNAGELMGGGLEVKLALNHWKLAIETHNTNFPNTIHECTDISACDPRRYPSTDILITSPECTNHSLAKGQPQVKKQMDLFASGKLDAAAERSRATMWDVPRFAEYHSYNIIVVENVVDARKWVMFDAWIHAMHCLGYNHKQVYLNSMHFYPCPQSRDRMYVVFWKKGNKAPVLDYTPSAYCTKCSTNVGAIQSWKKPDAKYGKYKTQYIYNCPKCSNQVQPYYYAAFNAIDWSDIGKRIGDREKPLSSNTIKRIEYGLKKYGSNPILFHRAYGDEARGVVRGMDSPFFTQTTVESQAMATPFVVNDQHSTGIDFRVRGVNEKFDTMATNNHMKLITPFIIKGEHTLKEGYTKEVTGPFQTQTVRQSMALVTPFTLQMNRTGKAKPVSQPMDTLTAGGINHGVVTTEAWNAFLAYSYNGTQVSHITEATDAATTKDRMALLSYNTPKLEDCYYRMIKAHEVKLAMAFDKDYTVLGSSKDQVKQLGNAVTPPVMQWLVKQCVESLS